MNELKVSVQTKQGEIKSNLDDLKAAIVNQMQAYEELEVTEENIPERKKDITALRKERTAIEDERKRVKEVFSAPLKEFEAKVKEVTGEIDKQISRLDGQVKEFDKKRIEDKQGHIKELYEANIGEYASFLPLASVKQDRWDNKTCGDNEIISDIQTKVMKVRSDLEAIKALGSEYEDKLIEAYKASGNDLSVAIRRNGEYTEIAKRQAEKTPAQPAELVQPTEPAWNAMNEPEWVIRIKGLENIEQVKSILSFNGIEYEEV